MQISVDNMWITVSSGVLGFSFIFGNSIRGVFESILTLFVIHPFDIGDTLIIKGDYCVVQEASLTKVTPSLINVCHSLTNLCPSLTKVCAPSSPMCAPLSPRCAPPSPMCVPLPHKCVPLPYATAIAAMPTAFVMMIEAVVIISSVLLNGVLQWVQ